MNICERVSSAVIPSFLLEVLGIKPKATYPLSMFSTTEPNAQQGVLTLFTKGVSILFNLPGFKMYNVLS